MNSSNLGYHIYDDLTNFERHFLDSFLSIELLLGFIFCSLIIILYIKYSAIRKSFSSFILCLTINNLLVVLWFTFVQLAFKLFPKVLESRIICALTILIPSNMTILSQMNFLGLLIYRFVNVRFPLKANTSFMKKFKELLALFVNCIAIVTFIAPFLYPKTERTICDGLITLAKFPLYLGLTLSFGPILLCIIIYFLLIRIARKQAKMMTLQTREVQSISKGSKIILLELIIVLIMWIIYLGLLKIIASDLQAISLKKSSIMEIIVISPTILISIIILLSNSEVKLIFNKLSIKARRILPLNRS